jgi:hypothetical protein
MQLLFGNEMGVCCRASEVLSVDDVKRRDDVNKSKSSLQAAVTITERKMLPNDDLDSAMDQ